MRIGILTDLCLPHISGITVFVDMYRRTLQSMGHEAHVISFGPAGRRGAYPFVHRTPGLPLGRSGFFINIRHASHCQRLIRSMDLLHVMHPFLSGSLAFRYRRSASTPVVFTAQTRYDLYLRHTLPAPARPAAWLFLRAYLPGFCRRCALVIAPSDAGVSMLRGLGVKGLPQVIPNAVDCSRFQPSVMFRGRRIRAVYIGRLAPEKNLPFLLRAFSLAAARCPALELQLVGDGPERQRLEALARELKTDSRIRFLGARPHGELPALLGGCDLFLTASTTEVHPLSLIEAMAAGLPAVGIAGEGIAETVCDGESGLLSKNDPADFAEAIVRLAEDPELGRRLSESAAHAAQAYDIRRVTRLHLEQFAALVPPQGAAGVAR